MDHGARSTKDEDAAGGMRVLPLTRLLNQTLQSDVRISISRLSGRETAVRPGAVPCGFTRPIASRVNRQAAT